MKKYFIVLTLLTCCPIIMAQDDDEIEEIEEQEEVDEQAESANKRPAQSKATAPTTEKKEAPETKLIKIVNKDISWAEIEHESTGKKALSSMATSMPKDILTLYIDNNTYTADAKNAPDDISLYLKKSGTNYSLEGEQNGQKTSISLTKGNERSNGKFKLGQEANPTFKLDSFSVK